MPPDKRLAPSLPPYPYMHRVTRIPLPCCGAAMCPKCVTAPADAHQCPMVLYPHPSKDIQAEALLLLCGETTLCLVHSPLPRLKEVRPVEDPTVPAYPKGGDRQSQSKGSVHRQGGRVSLEEPYPRNHHINNSILRLYPVRSVSLQICGHSPHMTVSCPLYTAY